VTLRLKRFPRVFRTRKTYHAYLETCSCGASRVWQGPDATSAPHSQPNPSIIMITKPAKVGLIFLPAKHEYYKQVHNLHNCTKTTAARASKRAVQSTCSTDWLANSVSSSVVKKNKVARSGARFQSSNATWYTYTCLPPSKWKSFVYGPGFVV